MTAAACPEAEACAPAPGGRSPVDRLFPWVMLGTVLLQLAGLNAHWSFQRDSALYMSLARSLAETGRYVFNYSVHTYALPGLPAMLAPIYATLGESFLAMNLLISAFAVGAVAMAYLLFRRVCHDGRQAAVCLVLFALSNPLFSYSTRILTEVPFTFFVLVALYCGVRMATEEGRRSLLWGLAAGLGGFAALGTRPFGLALFAALLGAIWLRRRAWNRWKLSVAQTAIVTSPLAAALLAWWLHSTGDGVSSRALTYAHFFIGPALPRVVLRMLRDVPDLLNAMFTAVAGGGLGVTGGVVMLAPLAVGLVQQVRRGDRLLAVYGLVYLAGVCVGSPSMRYVLPAVPVLLIWVVEGCWMLADRLEARFGWATRGRLVRLGYVILALSLLTHLSRITTDIVILRSPDFEQYAARGRLPRYRPLIEWIRDNVTPRQRTLAHEHRLIHYKTRIEAWRFNRRWRGMDPQTLAGRILRFEFSYVVLDPEYPFGTPELKRLMEACPDCFAHIGEFNGLELFRVNEAGLRDFVGRATTHPATALRLP